MKKDAYYFSHDANAQDDPKCMYLIDQLGMEGYGIFWALIEKLRAEKNYKLPLSSITSFAKRWGTEEQKVEKVVKNFKLFKINNNFFYSSRLKESMEKKTELAKASAAARWKDADANRTHNKRTPNGMQNHAIKVKEEKKNIPSDFSPGGKYENMVF